MSDHFINRCSCGAVIAQCRCPGMKTITVTKDGCPQCQAALEKDRAALRAWEQAHQQQAPAQSFAPRAVQVTFYFTNPEDAKILEHLRDLPGFTGVWEIHEGGKHPARNLAGTTSE